MKKLTPLLSFVFAATAALSQNAIPPSVRATTVLQRLGNLTPSDLVYGIPLPPKEVVGDSYLSQKWKNASLMLYGTEKLVEGYPVRLDLLKDELEIKTKSGVRVIEGRKIKSFVWVDTLNVGPQYFVNALEYKTKDNVALPGFFEIMVDGKAPLLLHTEAKIKKADYSPQLNVGSRDDKILKNEKLYYVADGKAIEVPRSRKKFVGLFGDKQQQVSAFIETNQLSPSNESHIRRIFEYYNTLL